MTLYSYAKLAGYDFGAFRFLGAGLGNLLLTWARFIVATERYGLLPLAPTWRQVKVGHLLRGESDIRLYGDLFQTPPNHLAGWRRLALLCTLPKIPEKALATGKPPLRHGILVFEGLREQFADILRDHDLVLARLLEMTRPQHKTGLQHGDTPSISIHIRLGDFASPGEGMEPGEPCVRVPLGWYVAKIAALRSVLGPLPVHVFSDGADDELREILALPNSHRLTFGSALADMLALSRAPVLVASPGSTFAVWAAYLGRMPVIWYPTVQPRQLHYNQPDAEIASSIGGNVPTSFFEAIRRRLSNDGPIV